MSRSLGLKAVFLICQWIFFSSAIILFNKYLLDAAHFHFPLTLVLLHMAFVSVCAKIWQLAGWVEVPDLSWKDIATKLLPVGAFFALSLSLGNAAYLYISVAFIQMLKATTPVAVLLTSFAVGLEKPNSTLAGCIIFISVGIGLACAKSVDFSIIGVSLQAAAVIAEACRLCLVNILLSSKGLKFSPIAFLYFVAPLCAISLLGPWVYLEARQVCAHNFRHLRDIGGVVLIANASLAFLLNLSTMALIKHTSALTLNVAGVVKDILLIVWSVVVSGAQVTEIQYVGYTIALIGLVQYSNYKRSQAELNKEEISTRLANEHTSEGEGLVNKQQVPSPPPPRT